MEIDHNDSLVYVILQRRGPYYSRTQKRGTQTDSMMMSIRSNLNIKNTREFRVSGGLTPCRQLGPSSRRENLETVSAVITSDSETRLPFMFKAK